ncbi:hypothetical protein [Chitinophaga cymbidii]|uniref:DUF4476 domain-containing protein n=1 Tax=Chitinophaga cymbidii TaxID=1096750 RepID=A0A512REY7_9BACT|nr:hypothetical protein [Chitinophaga cymbidii]GEP94204.1 hypothetical protein CCY01nite_04640 [Chitinophaga cymbidii]
MKRLLVLLTLMIPFWANAQKLSESAIENISESMAQQFRLRNDPALVFITEQMSRTGSGGLEVDKTMMELKKDPAAMDAALKFLYQFSDGNRQTLIANLRAMNISSGNVYPIATYVVNKYKGEAKALQEEKAELFRIGAIPKVTSVMVAPPANQPGNVTTVVTEPGTTAPATAAAPVAEAADTRNWDVRAVFPLQKPDELVNLYGKENVVLRGVSDLEGNDAGKAWVVYPDTNNEMEVVFRKDSTKTITFGMENSKWKSPFGIKPGDPIEKVMKINTRPFSVNGFEWTNGGIVNSWEGGALDKKGVDILFKAINSGDPDLYDKFTGDTKFKADNSRLKKLGVVVEKVVFTTYQ